MNLAKHLQSGHPMPIACSASATKQNNFRTFFVLKDQRAFPRHAFSGQCLCSPKEYNLFKSIKFRMVQELRFLIHGIGKAPSIWAHSVDLVCCLCYKTNQFLDEFFIERPTCIPKARVFRPMPVLTKRMHFVRRTYQITPSPCCCIYTTMQKLLVQNCFFTRMVPFKTISTKFFVT